MTEEIPGLSTAYSILFIGAVIFLAVLLVFCLIRVVLGPRVADRLVCVNMIGTMVMTIIAILTLMLGEGYLVDICLIYAMISFLAVIVLTKVYMGVYRERKLREGRQTGQQTEEMAEIAEDVERNEEAEGIKILETVNTAEGQREETQRRQEK